MASTNAVDKLRERISVLEKVLELRENFKFSDLNFSQKITALKQKSHIPYEVLRIPLTLGATNEMVARSGQLFYLHRVIDSSGNDVSGTLSCKFLRNDNPYPITLTAGQGVVTPFDRIFMTWTANSGAIAEVIISEDYELFRIVDNRLATAISTISSIGDITGDVSGLTSIPSGATQIHGRSVVTGGSATTLIYTVSGGVSLYIANACLGVIAASYGELFITDASDVRVKTILQVTNNSGLASSLSQNFLPQIVAPAGYKVKHRRFFGADADSTAADIIASFNGWEI